jgi:hypothetical protein
LLIELRRAVHIAPRSLRNSGGKILKTEIPGNA